ncbi:YicC family protein [Granulicella sp. WH15]|uniref:YicC/YloC family endoribonuclease n=1 Tax=Granulicella sp. WH15 TaxID=2602070 RepID=UPI001366DF86|nr:YicC/YloC family endoribonuclease [Granulicella sp. WH15]QHN04246.1 YicC family protein [Granulicella sp. WH15]
MSSANPVRSMTGFATARGASGEVGFALTLKSVNHRHLDLLVRVPNGLEGLEAALRKTLKERLRRGHVEFGLQLEKATAGGRLELNEALLASYAEVYRRASGLLGLSGDPEVHELLRMPGVIAAEAVRAEDAEMAAAVLAAVPELVDRFDAVRAAEGEALRLELLAGMGRIEAVVDEVTRLRGSIAETQVGRLRTRLAELLEGAGVQVAEERILIEASMLAERGDVEEELVRLRTHVGRFVELLEAGGELGRQLDFLLQELNREANTLLSKTGGAAGEAGLRITDLGLQVKVELERAREQVQNLE